MRKIYLFLFLFLIGYLITESLTQATIIRSSGSPGGSSGSPGVGNQTCTSCHGGTAVTRNGIITTDIPPEGYTPGNTYTITVTISDPARTTYGFEVRAEVNFQSVGVMTNISTAETKILSPGTNNESATHKSTSISASSGTKVWMFNWTAPAAGTGTVTFYGAFNAANGNGSSSGDNIYREQVSVDEFVAPCAINDANVAGDNAICEGEDVTIFVFGSEVGVTYYLRDNATLDTLDVQAGNGANISLDDFNVLASKTYQVLAVKSPDCTTILSDKPALVVHNYPVVTILSGNSDICEGSSIQFTAESTANTVEWTGPNGFSSTDLEPVLTNVGTNQTGYYVLTGFNAVDCPTQDSVFIQVVENDSLLLPSNFAEGCAGDTVNLSLFSSSDSAVWSGDNSTFFGVNPTPILTAADSGQYVITTTGVCPVSDTFDLIVKPLPTLILEFSKESACDGQKVVLAANTNGDSVLWQTPSGIDYSTEIVTLDTVSQQDSGLYTVTVVRQGCTASQAKLLSVSKQLAPVINQTGIVFKCLEDTLVLSTGNYESYTWSTGDTTQVIRLFGVINDTVGVQVASQGCVGETAIKTIVVTPILQPELDYDTVCSGDTVTIVTSEIYANYNWSNGDTSAAILLVESDSVFVQVQDTNGCVAQTEFIHIDFYDLPNDTILQIGGDSLQAPGTGVTYQWYKGDTLLSGNTEAGIKIDESGNYYVLITDTATGCSVFSDSVLVVITHVSGYVLSSDTRIIYPNPADHVFYFNTQGEEVNIEIYNAQGQQVLSGSIEPVNQSFDIRSLSSGIYTVMLSSHNFFRRQQLLVE